MKKTRLKLAKLALLVVTSLLVATTAFAGQIDRADEDLRYVNIQTIGAQLSAEGNNKVNCGGAVTTRNNYRVELTMELIQVDTGNVMNTWTASGYTTVRFTNKPWYVTQGHDYQVEVTAKIYNASNVCIETVGAVSDILEL